MDRAGRPWVLLRLDGRNFCVDDCETLGFAVVKRRGIGMMLGTMVGQTLGSYRITATIGTGGMGEVFLAEHVLIGKNAAIKVLLPHLSHQKDIVDRFFNEARAATAIRHPGIVDIFDFGYSDNGSAYIVMEYLDGESLDSRLRRLRTLSITRALQLTRQVAGTLEAAHKAEIVHRDLKPGNIFIVADPEVPGGERIKLLDFGIAKLSDRLSPDGPKTGTDVVMGTPAYMAPEQCKGAGRVDHRADLYSLGCILFRMLCGRPPFKGEGGGETIAHQIFSPPPTPSSMVSGIPPHIDGFVLALLAKAPGQRPQMARDVMTTIDAMTREALDPALSGSRRLPTSDGHRLGIVQPEQTTLSAGAAPVGTLANEPRWRAWVAIVAGIALVGAIAAVAMIQDAPSGRDGVGVGTAESNAAAVTREMVIESEPNGAAIMADGELLGKTPLRVVLSAGEERVLVLSHPEHEDIEVRLPDDTGEDGHARVRLTARMQPDAETAGTEGVEPIAEPDVAAPELGEDSASERDNAAVSSRAAGDIGDRRDLTSSGETPRRKPQSKKRKPAKPKMEPSGKKELDPDGLL